MFLNHIAQLAPDIEKLLVKTQVSEKFLHSEVNLLTQNSTNILKFQISRDKFEPGRDDTVRLLHLS